jgi:hypothetical protein
MLGKRICNDLVFHLVRPCGGPRLRKGDKYIHRKNVKLNITNKFVENVTDFQYLGKNANKSKLHEFRK